MAFHSQLRQESDRGSVIVAAALLDEALYNMLLCRLVPSLQREDELLDGTYAPLNSFSAKIDLAYRVGIIRQKLRSSLHLIRRLRNDFAHSTMENGFSTTPVQGRLRELFKLNEEIVNQMFSSVQKDQRESLSKRFNEGDPTKGAQEFIRVIGWRSTFELLVSVIASALKQLPMDIEPLTPPSI